MREVAAGEVEAQAVVVAEQIGHRKHRDGDAVAAPRLQRGRPLPRIAIAQPQHPSHKFIAEPWG